MTESRTYGNINIYEDCTEIQKDDHIYTSTGEKKNEVTNDGAIISWKKVTLLVVCVVIIFTIVQVTVTVIVMKLHFDKVYTEINNPSDYLSKTNERRNYTTDERLMALEEQMHKVLHTTEHSSKIMERKQNTTAARLVALEEQMYRDRNIANETIKSLQMTFTSFVRRTENQIAFTARLAKKEKYTNLEVLRFTDVVINSGGGINSTMGVFYCPVQGIYCFFVNIITYTVHAYAGIYKNDKFVMWVYTDAHEDKDNKLRSGSNQLIIQLNRYDKVSVKSWSNMSIGHSATSFSGFKL